MTTPTSPLGLTSLPHLIASLNPILHPSTFIFLTFPSSHQPPPTLLSAALLTFQEPEGLTLITPLSAVASAHNIPPQQMAYRSRMITCDVHSSLSAVGFLAAIAAKLAEVGISVNPVSGFFHDHLFVEEGRVEEAMGVLRGLAAEAKAGIEGGDGVV